jgi:hypothetical protein
MKMYVEKYGKEGWPESPADLQKLGNDPYAQWYALTHNAEFTYAGNRTAQEQLMQIFLNTYGATKDIWNDRISRKGMK